MKLADRGRPLLAACTLAFTTFLAGHSSADPLTPTTNSSGGLAGVFGEASDDAGGSDFGPTGAFTYSIPFDLPQARGLSQPKLALTYTSGGADGEGGLGWNLSLPRIERRPMSGSPSFIDPPLANSDRFEYNGQPLVYVCTVGSGSCGIDGATDGAPGFAAGAKYYRLQSDSLYARFFQLSARSWRVQFRGGIMVDFGDSTIAPTATQAGAALDVDAVTGIPVRFNISRASDPEPYGFAGNIVVYRWGHFGRTGRGYLTDVWDTPPASTGVNSATSDFAHHTQLVYEATDTTLGSNAQIEHAIRDYRLQRLSITAAPWTIWHSVRRSILRQYIFAYKGTRVGIPAPGAGEAPTWGHSYLASVTQLGECSSLTNEGTGEVVPRCDAPALPPVSFDYAPATIQSFASGTVSGTPMLGKSAAYYNYQGQLLSPDSAAVSTTDAYGFLGTYLFVPANGLLDTDKHDVEGLAGAVLDVDHDGRPDFVEGYGEGDLKLFDVGAPAHYHFGGFQKGSVWLNRSDANLHQLLYPFTA
jgi:hypothetical protein